LKRFDRVALLLSLACASVALILGIVSWFNGSSLVGKWLATAGLLFTLSGIFQLEVSGLFTKLIEHYGNEKEYPYGPPSHITREIIDNPDTPARTAVRNVFYFNMRTGFWLIAFGTVVQAIAVWQ